MRSDPGHRSRRNRGVALLAQACRQRDHITIRRQVELIGDQRLMHLRMSQRTGNIA
ncbi:MAG TPA: hypothetical protein VFZ00_01215 [Solirubrobacter sp.]|nr:hypothetical protein [Solirubrobacter sp.]